MTSVEPPLQPLQPQPLQPQPFQPLFQVLQPLFQLLQLLQPQPLFQVVRVAVLKVVNGWFQPHPQPQTVGLE